MAVDPTAYFVGGGAEHSPETVRAAYHESTGGNEGVSGALDLKVVPLSPAGAGVNVLSGGGTLINRYPGGQGQSYAGRAPSQTFVPITATGTGGGRSDLIVMRVLDPQYEGQPPADPLNFDYTRLRVIEGVAPNTVSALDLNLGYPAIALGRVDMPVNTATVAQGYVTDLRQLTQPKIRLVPAQFFPNTDKVMTKNAYSSWPFSGIMSNIAVPWWANRVEITATVNGIEITGSTTVDNVAGVRTAFDMGAGGTPNYSENGILKGKGGTRQSISIVGSHPIPANRRGKTVGISLQGNQTVGTGTFQGDYQTSIAVLIIFKEELS